MVHRTRFAIKQSVTRVESKTYRQLREDSERFSAALDSLGEQGSHIAIVGDNS